LLGNSPPVEHFAAPPLDKAPALYQRIAAQEGTIYRAVECMILSATRLRETLDAKFSEVDLAAKTWTIPAARAKMSRDHVVPLSEAAIRCFERVAGSRSCGYLFPGRFGDAPFGSTALSLALRRIGVTGLTNHGWRSVAKDAMAEKLDIDNETSEFALGHVKTGLEAAYRRGSSIEKRRVAMEKYSLWLAGIGPATNVVPFVKAAP
jgi:integrase